MKKIEKIVRIIGIFAVIWFLGSIILTKQCKKPLQEPTKNAYLLPSESYQPPIVKIPFLTKDKLPVSKANLPIRKKDVKTTIVIKNPVPGAKDITIVIDKKGDVHKSKDTPSEVNIKVTHWKPALFGLQNKWGVGVIMDIPPDMSFALSWDVVRIWKLHFGLDLGVKFKDQAMVDIWLGASVKYKILKNNNLFMLAGYNWTHGVPYVGIMIRF